MTILAPTLEAFFTQHMAGQRQASPRTIGSYRDTWRLFLGYALEKTGTAPAGLDIAALDAGLVSGFLAHLEQDRGNTARTRNARLAAIRSFFKFAALRHPEHAGTIARVLAVPAKKHGRRSVSYLTANAAFRSGKSAPLSGRRFGYGPAVLPGYLPDTDISMRVRITDESLVVKIVINVIPKSCE